MAAEKVEIEVLQNLWEWAKEILTQEELNNMFLAEELLGRTAWHMAAEKGQIEVLYILSDWFKKVLNKRS